MADNPASMAPYIKNRKSRTFDAEDIANFGHEEENRGTEIVGGSIIRRSAIES
jgi:hypothetical protein